MESRDSRVLIVDEAHEFDDVMSDFITIKITESVVKKFKFSNEKEILRKLKLVTSITEYVDFLKYLSTEIITTIEQMEGGLSTQRRNEREDKRDLKISKILKTKNTDVKVMQLVTDLKQYQLKIEFFLK